MEAAMFSFIGHPFLAPEIISFMSDSEDRAALLPGDEWSFPWSHNILAANVASVHTCHSRRWHRCGRQALVQRRGPSLPLPPPGALHTQRCDPVALRPPLGTLQGPPVGKALTCHRYVHQSSRLQLSDLQGLVL